MKLEFDHEGWGCNKLPSRNLIFYVEVDIKAWSLSWSLKLKFEVEILGWILGWNLTLKFKAKVWSCGSNLKYVVL